MAALLVQPAAAQDEAGRADEAEPAVTIAAEYRLDMVGLARGRDPGFDRVDYLSFEAEASLERLVGWQGAHVFAHAIAATGERPNDRAGTLQGVNNIEVPENRIRLFQLYFEQELPLADASLRLGLSDLNAEFYANDAAGLLIAPAFGIGSELAATGPNGPAIFPSTALMARLRVEPWEGGYAMAAVVNAEAGVPGDRGGMRPLFSEGALLIGELGTQWGEGGKIGLGMWRYTQGHEDIRDLDGAGDPLLRRAQGAYLLAELPVTAGATLFARAGISDGKTTPFIGGWQAGVLATGVIAGRPDGQLSLGFNQAYLSDRFRRNSADEGTPLGGSETAIEITYADQLTPWLTVQPDAQFVFDAAESAGRNNAIVVGLRLTVSYPN